MTLPQLNPSYESLCLREQGGDRVGMFARSLLPSPLTAPPQSKAEVGKSVQRRHTARQRRAMKPRCKSYNQGLYSTICARGFPTKKLLHGLAQHDSKGRRRHTKTAEIQPR